MKIYIAGTSDLSFVEANRDDPTSTVEDFAYPNVTEVALNCTPEWVAYLKNEASKRYSACFDENDYPDLQWEESAWLKTAGDRRMMTIIGRHDDGTPGTAVVIIEMEVSDG